METSTLHIILLFFMSLGAAFVQRVSGFGFGIFIMTVLPYLMPSYAEATTLSGMLAMIMSLFIVVRHYHHLRWRKVMPMLCVFLLTSLLAIQFVSTAGEGILKIFLGIILITASFWFLFLAQRIRIRPNVGTQIGLGSLSGIMGGLFGMQGPPAVLYFVETTETKEEYLVTAQAYFLIGNFCMTGYRAFYGFLTSYVLQSWCYGLISVAIGTWLGSIAFRHLSLGILRKIIYIYMAVSGLYVVIS